MKVLLIGMRASGKSTVGAALAVLLGVPFLDLDDVVASRMGSDTAAASIRVHGFEKFRKEEVTALALLLSGEPCVIALGGGTPTAPGAASLIRAACASGGAVAVFIDETAQQIKTRIARDGVDKRPAILGTDPIGEVDEILAIRRPLYLELASIVVAPAGRPVDDLVREIAIAIEGGRH